VNMRDRLAAKFQRIILRLGQDEERAGRYEAAAQLYRRGLEQDNLAEELYRRLMHCELCLGQRAEVIKTYRRCRDMLSINLQTRPSSATEALHRRVLADISAIG
jgi:two-component SAPR family response regulator